MKVSAIISKLIRTGRAWVSVLGGLTVVTIMVTACGPRNGKPNVELIQDMMEQPALKAQDFLPDHRDTSSMLVPPKGAWPKNRTPYLYWTDPVAAGQKMSNPYANDKSPEFAQLGKIHFNNYCIYCHGEKGDGKGNVAEKWKPIVVPSLLTEKIRNYPDGRIFHIITAGQGLMGSYATQMPFEKDRWAVVNYVRELQKNAGRGQ